MFDVVQTQDSPHPRVLSHQVLVFVCIVAEGRGLGLLQEVLHISHHETGPLPLGLRSKRRLKTLSVQYVDLGVLQYERKYIYINIYIRKHTYINI